LASKSPGSLSHQSTQVVEHLASGMPVVAFLIDTVYDVCVFQFCKNQREFSIWWFAAARLAWGAVKWIISPRKEGSSKRVLPQLYDFTLDEQKEILQASVKIPSWVHFPDLERAEWINVVLARIWTPFGRYMNRLFKEWLEPLIQTAIGNKVSFKFDKVDFGSIPIRLSGAKAYKENVDRREIILDLEVYYNGDAELTVTISGIKAGVKNIQLRGTLRIVLKPVLMDMPFLGMNSASHITFLRSKHCNWCENEVIELEFKENID
jgi:hypothetical protein